MLDHVLQSEQKSLRIENNVIAIEKNLTLRLWIINGVNDLILILAPAKQWKNNYKSITWTILST